MKAFIKSVLVIVSIAVVVSGGLYFMTDSFDLAISIFAMICAFFIWSAINVDLIFNDKEPSDKK